MQTLLVLTLIASVPLGFKTADMRRQTEAIAKLRARGANVVVEPAAASRAGIAFRIKWALGIEPHTVKVELFETYLGDGAQVLFASSLRNWSRTPSRVVNDDDVLLIGDIHDTTEVWLSSDHITAKSLRALARLPKLQRLELGSKVLGDDEIGELRNCARLKELQLYVAAVGDVGIDRIAELSQLEQLCLYPVVAADENALQLGNLQSLKELVLYGNGLDGKLEATLSRMLPRCFVVVEPTGLYLSVVKDESLFPPDPQ